jgi:hypothetical protein
MWKNRSNRALKSLRARYATPPKIEDLQSFDPDQRDDLLAMVQSIENVFSGETSEEIDSLLLCVCETAPHYVCELPGLLGDADIGPAVESICSSILSLVEVPHSPVSLEFATVIFYLLSLHANIDFVRFLQRRDLFTLFRVIRDPLSPFGPDVLDALADREFLSAKVEELILLSISFIIQVPEILQCDFPVPELASDLCRLYRSLEDCPLASLILGDISSLVNMYYCEGGSPGHVIDDLTTPSGIVECRLLPIYLADHDLPLSITLLKVIWAHQPDALFKLLGGADLSAVFQEYVASQDLNGDEPIFSAMLRTYDCLSWTPSVLQRLITAVVDAGRADWLNECLELLIQLAKTPPRGVFSLMPRLLYRVLIQPHNLASPSEVPELIPFEFFVQQKDEEFLRLFAILCRKLMYTDLPGCEFIPYFHETGVIVWLNSIVFHTSFVIAEHAMHALVANMGQFGPEIIDTLLGNDFLHAFERLCNTMSHTSKFLRALIHIVEFVGRESIERQLIFLSQWQSLDMWTTVLETNDAMGDNFDEELINYLHECLSQIVEAATASGVWYGQ